MRPNPEIVGPLVEACYGEVANKTPYVFGGTQLGSGVDCSGLFYGALNTLGVPFPNGARTAQQQRAECVPITKDEVLIGDFVFYFDTYTDDNLEYEAAHSLDGRAASHVGLIVRADPGALYMIDANSVAGQVTAEPVWHSYSPAFYRAPWICLQSDVDTEELARLQAEVDDLTTQVSSWQSTADGLKAQLDERDINLAAKDEGIAAVENLLGTALNGDGEIRVALCALRETLQQTPGPQMSGKVILNSATEALDAVTSRLEALRVGWKGE